MENLKQLVEKEVGEVAGFLRSLNKGRLPSGITAKTIRYFVANAHKPISPVERAKLAGYKRLNKNQIRKINRRIESAHRKVDLFLGGEL